MRLLKRTTITCVFAATALTMMITMIGCKYETGPPDYSLGRGFGGGETRG